MDYRIVFRVNGRELMNSRQFGSEKMPAELSRAGITRKKTRVY
jgi:hypothetical protein